MPFFDKVSHAATVTKWKADQQMRILKVQGEINEIEQKIRVEKSDLADTTLNIFFQDNLLNEELKVICTKISDLRNQINEKQRFQEAIRLERPPEQPVYTSKVIETPSGLVCPECGKEIVGKYCPEHGKEGIRKIIPPDNIEIITPQESGPLVCPICRKTLSVRFCPEHGVEGVPAGQF